MFSNPMYKPVWFKAFGLTCFTRLVSRKQGGFLVTSDPVLQHTTTDLEETISQMSPELQAAARKLAEGGDEGSLTSKGSKRASPRASSPSIASAASLGLAGLRVEVAALAGYDPGSGSFDGGGGSGGVSPAGPSFTGGQRTSRLAPPGHPARLASLGAAAVAAGEGCHVLRCWCVSG